MLLLLACTPAQIELASTKNNGGDPVVEDSAGGDDSQGNQGGDDSGPTEEPEAPVAVISVATTGEVGSALVFDGTGSYDPAGQKLAGYAWECSDGSTRTESTISLTPQIAGELSCSLSVTSKAGLIGKADALSLIQAAMAEWTIMVYINGDNNLEEYGLLDLNELEQVGSTSEVNFIVQMDRAQGYDRGDGDWTSARRYRVANDGRDSNISSEVIEDIGEVDSGKAQTFIDFAEWAVTNYPARHYGFVFWDHGDGWYLNAENTGTKGISWDDQSRRQLSVADGDVSEVLSGVTDFTGQKLDFVGFDACLMADWEVAVAVAPYADTLVASQDYESSYGWSYDDAFGPLVADPSMDAAGVGDAIAQTFYESGDSTMSVTDLGAISALTATLDDLADALLASDQGKDIWSASVRGGWSYYGDDRDIGGLLGTLAESDDSSVARAASDALGAYENVILSNWVQSKKGSGLSIYAPTGRMESSYTDGPWASQSKWDDMLSAMTGR